jgi:ASC-1-like (ASCH) protein
LSGIKAANYHLVIIKKPYLNAILKGQKQIELRMYKTRNNAFGRVFPGDKLFLKQSAGPVCGTATVETVKNYENLTPGKIIEIKQQYNHAIGANDEHWQNKMDCKFCFLVWLKEIKSIEPMRIEKKDWRAWVVLTDRENFGLI